MGNRLYDVGDFNLLRCKALSIKRQFGSVGGDVLSTRSRGVMLVYESRSSVPPTSPDQAHKPTPVEALIEFGVITGHP